MLTVLSLVYTAFFTLPYLLKMWLYPRKVSPAACLGFRDQSPERLPSSLHSWYTGAHWVVPPLTPMVAGFLNPRPHGRSYLYF